MKLFISTSFLFAFALAGIGQGQIPDTPSRVLHGKIKSSIIDRTYVIKDGVNVGSLVVRLYAGYFDNEGRVVQASIFGGNGEVRRIYRRSGKHLSVEVLYFDKFGNPTTDKAEPFAASMDGFLESGLCSKFTVQRDDDPVGKIKRETELCPDGSIRARTVWELGQKGELWREIRTDSLSRSWESILSYDSAGNATEFRYIVTDEKGKSYTQTMYYVEHKFDAQGNPIRVTATAFHSKYPGRLTHQYVEHWVTTYYEN